MTLKSFEINENIVCKRATISEGCSVAYLIFQEKSSKIQLLNISGNVQLVVEIDILAQGGKLRN